MSRGCRLLHIKQHQFGSRSCLHVQARHVFNRRTVPLRFRSRILRKDGQPVIDPETGEPMRVATIRDVIAWSHTAWGAHQYAMYFPDEAAGACTIGGECE